MNNILENYNKAVQELYDHVGFEESWVLCPIDTDTSSMYWYLDKDSIYFAYDHRDFETEVYYKDEIYTQRFYKKHVYEGSEYTLVFCDPQTDGVKWFRIFSNRLRLQENPIKEE